MYQENCKRRLHVVPPLRFSYGPDTNLDISARKNFWFSKCSRLNLFRKPCVSGESLQPVLCRATSQIPICSWYRNRTFIEKELLVFDIFALEFLSKYLCIRRTATGGALSCHLLDCHMLLIQNSKFQREAASHCRDIPAWISFEIALYQENS